MKYGFRICYHKEIGLCEPLKDFLDSKVEHFCSEDSYKERTKSAAFCRRGILGMCLDENFKTSSKPNVIYTFKRLSRNRRIFGVVPLSKIDFDHSVLNQCMCAEHRGGERVNLIKPYDEEDYITYFETGEIKG